jgi:hypothetical protein
MCSTLNRNDWVEVFAKSRKLISNCETFTKEWIDQELQTYGDFKVLVSMGVSNAIEELYLFGTEQDARRFFQGGPLLPVEQSYCHREYAELGGCCKGIGFDRVELHIPGKLIDRR